MNTFVESLKRLYASQKITQEKIELLFKSNKINESEKAYILRKE